MEVELVPSWIKRGAMQWSGPIEVSEKRQRRAAVRRILRGRIGMDAGCSFFTSERYLRSRVTRRRDSAGHDFQCVMPKKESKDDTDDRGYPASMFF